jgi:hypothetical protein
MATSWRIALIQDISEGNSDKTFTIPANTEWEMLSILVQYASTATAGSRQLEIQFQDSGSIIAQWQTGISQNENLNYSYFLGVGVPDLNTVRDVNYIMTPLMGAAFLIGGQSIRVWDNNAIDPTDDDMFIKIEYAYHEI